MADFLAGFENLWFLLDFAEGVVFVVLAVYFRMKKGSAGFLISDFSRLPKKQRESYDLEGLGKYLYRVFLLCGAICFAGAFASIPLGAPAYWVTTTLWIVVAAVTLRMDNEKLLRKYRKE